MFTLNKVAAGVFALAAFLPNGVYATPTFDEVGDSTARYICERIVNDPTFQRGDAYDKGLYIAGLIVTSMQIYGVPFNGKTYRNTIEAVHRNLARNCTVKATTTFS
jgi:hypothetical protein